MRGRKFDDDVVQLSASALCQSQYSVCDFFETRLGHDIVG